MDQVSISTHDHIVDAAVLKIGSYEFLVDIDESLDTIDLAPFLEAIEVLKDG